MRRWLLISLAVVVLLPGGCAPASNGKLQAAPVAPAPTIPMPAPLPTTPSVQPPSGGAKAPAPSATTLFTAVFMTTASDGWALGSAEGGGVVLRTADGGQTWRDVTPPDTSMAYLYPHQSQTAAFLDASTGWITGRSGSNLVLLRTINGGETWQSAVIKSDAADMSAQISFPDAKHGWLLLHMGAAAGSEGVAVMQTGDGGATWTQVAATKPPDPQGKFPFGFDKTGLAFRTDGAGWVTTYSADDSTLALYVTRDGGTTWQSQRFPMPAVMKPFAGSLTSYPPLFFDEDHGVLPVMKDDNRVLFLVTRDGGKQWAGGSPVNGSSDSRGIWDFVSPSKGWIWTGSRLQTTADGGMTWTELATNNALQDVQQLDFLTPQVGWAVLRNGQVLKTTDGGSTWQAVRPE